MSSLSNLTLSSLLITKAHQRGYIFSLALSSKNTKRCFNRIILNKFDYGIHATGQLSVKESAFKHSLQRSVWVDSSFDYFRQRFTDMIYVDSFSPKVTLSDCFFNILNGVAILSEGSVECTKCVFEDPISGMAGVISMVGEVSLSRCTFLYVGEPCRVTTGTLEMNLTSAVLQDSLIFVDTQGPMSMNHVNSTGSVFQLILVLVTSSSSLTYTQVCHVTSDAPLIDFLLSQDSTSAVMRSVNVIDCVAPRLTTLKIDENTNGVTVLLHKCCWAGTSDTIPLHLTNSNIHSSDIAVIQCATSYSYDSMYVSEGKNVILSGFAMKFGIVEYSPGFKIPPVLNEIEMPILGDQVRTNRVHPF